MTDNTLSNNYIKQTKRHTIETFISGIQSLFPKHIHAINAKGFLIKSLGFILAYNCNLFLK